MPDVHFSYQKSDRHRKIKPRPGDVSNFSDKGKFPTVNIIEAKKGRNFS